MVHSVPFVLVELEPDVDPFHPSPVRGPGRERACPVANQAAADQHAAAELPIIRQIKRAGARTLREIADALNERGVRTARGGQWYATTVTNVLARA